MSTGAAPTGIAKVLVVGDIASGKTSVIKRYAKGTFSDDYATTIGVDFALKKVEALGRSINVQLWDIAGQERFAGLSRIFYAHSVAAIVVFDLFNRSSFESTARWKKDIDNKVFLPSGARIPVLLLGNKCDLAEEGQAPAVTDEEIALFARQHDFFAHFKCSAKTGENVSVACHHLVIRVAENEIKEKDLAERKDSQQAASAAFGAGTRAPSAAAAPVVKLDNPSAPPAKSGGCC